MSKRPEQNSTETGQEAPEEQLRNEENSAVEELPVEVDDSPEEEDPESRLQAEAAKWRDLALRSQAELDNFRKRMAREKADAVRYANASLLESLLPIIDNFYYGLEAARLESEKSVVFQGISMVARQFQDFLADNGVQEVPAEGLRFDPNVHDAVEQKYSDQVEEGVVLNVIRKGYRLNDRLLRAANVVVSRGAQPREEEDSAS